MNEREHQDLMHPPSREVLLEQLTYQVGLRVSAELLGARVQVEKAVDLLTQQIMLQVRLAILAQRLDEQVVQYPRDWWQAFKARWFPAWLKDRWPVQYTKQVMRLYGAYPQLQLALRGDEAHLVVRVTGEESRVW